MAGPTHDIWAHTDAAHEAGPHILDAAGTPIEGWSIFGLPITTTVFSTWIFMGVLFLFVAMLYIAIRTQHFSGLRTFGLDVIRRMDDFFTNTIGSKKYARVFLPMMGGFFAFILLGNIFGLILDWVNMVAPSMHAYLRPFNSDINTTIVMALIVIFVVQIAGMIRQGFFKYWGHFFFHFSGNNITEKIINVPVGWIHLVSEAARILSLSVRLFANIFSGVALIAVMAYLGTMIPVGFLGGIITLPFWFYELFVAFLQAFIFIILSLIYLRGAVTVEEH